MAFFRINSYSLHLTACYLGHAGNCLIEVESTLRAEHFTRNEWPLTQVVADLFEPY